MFALCRLSSPIASFEHNQCSAQWNFLAHCFDSPIDRNTLNKNDIFFLFTFCREQCARQFICFVTQCKMTSVVVFGQKKKKKSVVFSRSFSIPAKM